RHPNGMILRLGDDAYAATTNIEWIGAARVRLGYAFDRFLHMWPAASLAPMTGRLPTICDFIEAFYNRTGRHSIWAVSVPSVRKRRGVRLGTVCQTRSSPLPESRSMADSTANSIPAVLCDHNRR